MESPASTFATLFEKIEEYTKTTFDLYKLRFLDTATIVTTSLVVRLSVIIMIGLFVLVCSVGIALFLGEQLGKPYYGFFVVAGFYLIIGIVMHFFLGKWIKTPIGDSIIKQTLQNGNSWKN